MNAATAGSFATSGLRGSKAASGNEPCARFAAAAVSHSADAFAANAAPTAGADGVPPPPQPTAASETTHATMIIM